MNTRIAWVDTAKGIGIILIVLGHSVHTVERAIIFAFHVPLFFFLSGYLFTKALDKNFFHFVSTRIRGILIPYFSFSIFSYAFWFFIGNNVPEWKHAAFWKPLLGILYSVPGEWMIHNNPLWFLTCLFIVELYSYILFTLFRNSRHILILFLIPIGFLSKYLPFRLPWSADIAVTALAFFTIGSVYRTKYDEKLSILRRNTCVLVVIMSFSVLYLSVKANGFVDLASNKLGNPLFYYMGAISGILMTVSLSKILSGSRILQFFGRNSIIVLGLHHFMLQANYFLAVKGIRIGPFIFAQFKSLGPPCNIYYNAGSNTNNPNSK